MKILNIKGLIIISLILVLLFIIYSKFIEQNQPLVEKNLEINQENFTNSNLIKDIKYSSKDLKGNEYTITADEGEIDLNNTNIIFLKNVIAYIKLIKNNEIIKISSNFGKYNTVNYDTIFSKKVKVDYINNNLTGDYLDFSMMNNLLIMSKNVIYTNPNNILKADVVELNTITKDTKIFMYNAAEKVEVKSKK
tara:strand:- start:729 stop:1307 length:579 start_codon:yes stop_codon:yes gene_type:complete